LLLILAIKFEHFFDVVLTVQTIGADGFIYLRKTFYHNLNFSANSLNFFWAGCIVFLCRPAAMKHTLLGRVND